VKKIGTTLLCIVLSSAIYAQHYIGVGVSDFSPANSVYLNPASIVEYPDRFTLDLFAVNAAVDNNMLGLNTGYAFNSFFSQTAANSSKLFVTNKKDQLSVTGPYLEARLPGFTWSISPTQSIAVGTRLRMFYQFNGIDKGVFETIVNPEGTTENTIGDNALGKFDATMNTWSEIGITNAGVAYNRGAHKIKYGVTLRYLNGISYVTAASKQDTTYYVANKVFAVNNNVLVGTNLFGRLGDYPGGNAGTVSSWLLGNNGGHGMGADVGVEYEYNPYENDRYLFRISAAVTDIGYINYVVNNRSVLYKQIGGATKDSANMYITAIGYKLPGVTVTEMMPPKAAQIYLPTTLITHVDYHMSKDYFVDLLFIGNLGKKDETGNAIYSQFTLTPYYDTKAFGFAFPISYSFLSKKVKTGVGARFGKFFIGSDDMLLLFMKGQQGANIYMGGSVSLGAMQVHGLNMNIHRPKLKLHFKKKNKPCSDCEPVMFNWGGR